MEVTPPPYADLLAGVCAAPDDDTPRLVLADWFDENGDPDRAEFVRLQCALELRLAGRTCPSCLYSPDPDCVWQLEYGPRNVKNLCRECGRSRGRQEELLSANAGRWLSEWAAPAATAGSRLEYLAPYDCDPYDGVFDNPYYGLTVYYGGHHGLVSVEFRRGFVARVQCWWAFWFRHAEDLAWHPEWAADEHHPRPYWPGAHPVTHLHLTTLPEVGVSRGGLYTSGDGTRPVRPVGAVIRRAGGPYRNAAHRTAAACFPGLTVTAVPGTPAATSMTAGPVTRGNEDGE